MIKLNDKYEQLSFLELLQDLLPDFEKDIRKIDITSFKVFESGNYLGKSKKLDLQIFEVKHQSSNTARVAIATDGFRLMKQSAVYRALIVFRTENSDDWRLSLMTLTPERDEKGGVSVQVSNPRRYSFFLGPQAKINTPYKFLKTMGQVADFDDLQKRFSVEVVNKEFYEKISLLFTNLIGGERKISGKNKLFEASLALPSHLPEINHQLYAEFAVRLIGRIVFCWFLKQKKSDAKIPLISDKFLGSQSVGQNYYHTILEPLFFEILNKDLDKRITTLPSDAKLTPYLNGGLFEQNPYDFYEDQPNYGLKIPDSWFIEFFNILETYNFTIDENTSVDIELSIDPEMLGRIFENLLAEINPETGESARKNTGSYYTPRTIVDYMVQTSLREFLQSKFPPTEREYLNKDNFLKLCHLDNEDLLKFIESYFHKTLLINVKYFADEEFANIIVSPRIIAKLRGLDIFGKNETTHAHPQVNLELWQSFLSGEVEVVDKLYGKIKNIKLKKRHPWVTVCLIFKYNNQLFAAFFSPLLTRELSLTTIYTIDEKRYQKLKMEHRKIDLEKIFNIKRKSSRKDADLLHTGTSPAAAQRFSTLRKLLSDFSVLDEELRVKLGAQDMVQQEVEQILSGTPERETEDSTKQRIVDALDNLKVLDPACGSGAFPMGVLQKVVQILQEVDPKNELYLEKIIQSNLPELRPKIRESLKHQNWNYARKLGIIRKSIFGVDIQPIATEISRLRVFLSLIVDQNIDDALPNRGIEVLPNLDFKFVTANSLIGLPSENSNAEQQTLLGTEEVSEINELREIMEGYFNSHNSERKEYKNRFYKIRNKLFEHVVDNNFWNEKTKYLSTWDPFDHELTPWFNPEWMFGIKSGFDIVLGNPPYVSTKGIDDKYKKSLMDNFGFADDLYSHFYFKGLELCKNKGVLGYITSKTFWTIQTKKNVRELLLKNNLVDVYDTDNPFESVMVATCVIIVKKDETQNNNIVFLKANGDYLNPVKQEVKKSIYQNAVNKVIFNPSLENMAIYHKYNPSISQLINKWWSMINTSKNVTKSSAYLNGYRSNLKAGDVTLLGLITDGGQGLATANNGKYVGVLDSTKEATKISEARVNKLFEFITKQKIDKFGNSKESIRNYLSKLSEIEIREIFDSLKLKYSRDIFGQGFLYRIVSKNEIKDVSVMTGEEKKNGLIGTQTFVPYDKGDKDGNRWYLRTPYYLDWGQDSVKFLESNSGKKGKGMPVVRNPQFYFRSGFCWILTLNEQSEYLKSRVKEAGVFDVNAMSLFPMCSLVSEKYLVCLINSYLIYQIKINFINGSSAFQMNDARQIPIIVPNAEQLLDFENLFDRAYSIKVSQFDGKITNLLADQQLLAIQNELDEKVLTLYNLRPEEIEIV